ncbi:MAG TPA: hypothetical protein VE476_10835 [Propionibacteriaceae bacterium]|jgi:hypothetical protein|nr:hypothetical protein [Propionibacteriaceae bacterium]
MTTFDASTGHSDIEDTEETDSTPLETPEERTGTGSLAQLGAAAKQRTALDPEVVEVPGVPIRLVCHPDISSKALSNWQRRALPPKARNSTQISPFMMDQSIFHAAVLVNTCRAIEVKRAGSDDEWNTIVSDRGDVLTLKDRAVWDQLGALDSASTIKRLFPRDSDLSKAGQQVLDAAGWTEKVMYDLDDEDASDPTS